MLRKGLPRKKGLEVRHRYHTVSKGHPRLHPGLPCCLHLPIRIARRYRLDETVAAHEDQDSGRAIGNIVIDIAGEKNAHT